MAGRSSPRKLAVIAVGLIVAVSLGAASCESDSNDAANKASDDAGRAAQSKWGTSPNITNYSEYKMANEVYELRDKANLVMYAYIQGNDGALRCYGQVVGYGIPYATQLTPPYRALSSTTEPVREPNGLFMPDSAEATWLRVIDPATGKTSIEYVEPRVIVSPIKRPCKPLDQ